MTGRAERHARAVMVCMMVADHGGNIAAAARAARQIHGIADVTFRRWLTLAHVDHGLTPENVKQAVADQPPGWPLVSISPEPAASTEVVTKHEQAAPIPAQDQQADEMTAGERKRLQARIRSLQDERDSLSDLRRHLFPLVSSWKDEAAFRPIAESEHGESTPILLCSDWQIGEVVDLAEMDGINEFNMDIAAERAERLFNKAIELADMKPVAKPRIVLACIGDMINGEIHDELAVTNDLLSAPAVQHTGSLLRAGIERLLEYFGSVHVVWVDGNHDRATRKIWSKKYADVSYGGLCCWWLQSAFERDQRVTFQRPKSGDAVVDLYGWRVGFCHGDRMGSKGGTGLIGALYPMLRGHHKIMRQYADLHARLDYVCTGHLHTSARLPTGVGNGALVGYNEYARTVLRAAPEAPQQAMLWFTRRHGMWSYESIHLGDTPRIDTARYSQVVA